MSAATVTVRQVKNKDSGVDLSVTSYHETKGMVGSTYLYQVMVVSSLPCFKSAKHKDADNVQFTVMKKLQDFEDLHGKLNTKFSGTVLPVLPKKVLMANEAVAKERRNNLDHFVKFIASMPKICTDPLVLTFLGVSSSRSKSGQLQKLTVSDSTVEKTEDSTEESAPLDDMPEQEEDLFETGEGGGGDSEEEDIFGDEPPVSNTGDRKLFDDPDLSGALQEGEGDELFIEGSRSNTATTQKVKPTVEDNADLFGSDSDEDLDKIMDMKLTSGPEATDQSELEADDKADIDQSEDSVVSQSDDTSQNNQSEETSQNNQSEETMVGEEADPPTKPAVTPKPALPAKPALSTKPALSKKPGLPGKPAVSTKPTLTPKPVVKPKPGSQDISPDIAAKSPVTDASAKPKPPIKSKPGLPQKPALKAKPKVDSAPVVPDQKDANVETLTEDDIMKYIQENVSSGGDDLDLFS
ncbi:HCLS1-binding protein 3-like isoform X2 [Mya arenaria]|uniref:HCLS1-binding protein 3-like isoform X2 n=1 Tax=Mya arenaria TaxID=6604 RepID=UPI0022E5B302|nr:HCLS1-binding protein 3-like isoform X2 [Mya arenaria]